MANTTCNKCGRDIKNNNFERHYRSCDGTLFYGPNNPNKRKTKKPEEEIYQIRVQNAKKARMARVGKPAWNKGVSVYSDEEVFCINGKGMIKNLFLKRVAYECSSCNISTWKGNPITLEMDHINGNNKDHRIENLRLLCPNCHSQTSTYKNKNKNNVRKVSDCEILSALTSCSNIRQVLLTVGLQDQGANYKRIKKIIEKYNITLPW